MPISANCPADAAALGITRLQTITEVEAVFAEAAGFDNEAARWEFLMAYYYDAGPFATKDPFSTEYLEEVIARHAHISGGDRYVARENELAPHLPERDDLVRSPSPYRLGPTSTLGDFYIAFGFILEKLSLHAGQSVLEYGPGAGQLALAFARNGCDVTVVDVEPRYIEAITEQAARLDVPIRAYVGEFGDAPEPGRRYDAVLFFEAFHHALYHNDLLRSLHELVDETGRVAVAGEPIIGSGNMWEVAIPFAWGPRTDLLSVWSMRTCGWMELGFRESYFLEAAARAEWDVAKHECPLSFRGNTWVLTKSSARATLSKASKRTSPPPAEAGSPFFHYNSCFDALATIKRHARHDLQPHPDYLTNFLGVLIDPKVLPEILNGREGQVEPVPIPANWHADIAEWAAALRAVELADKSFTMAELGCGWGCWMNNTGAAARARGLDVQLIGLDADKRQVALAREACMVNSFAPEDVILRHGTAAPSPGRSLVGQAPVTLAEIIGDRPRLDLVHIDIEGAEARLVEGTQSILNERVAYLVIGTGSRENEGLLLSCFLGSSWRLEIERPAIITLNPEGPSTTVDGVQGWRNLALAPD
jgi:2-polyprenyl-3-methyl-5-hydroxy-6-metoxy-1,4-benzoquinol methylase